MAKSARAFEVEIDLRLCKGTEGCRICISMCPHEVLAPGGRLTARGTHTSSVVAADRCTGCELCMLYCPDLAIVVTQAAVVAPEAQGTGLDTE